MVFIADTGRACSWEGKSVAGVSARLPLRNSSGFPLKTAYLGIPLGSPEVKTYALSLRFPLKRPPTITKVKQLILSFPLGKGLQQLKTTLKERKLCCKHRISGNPRSLLVFLAAIANCERMEARRRASKEPWRRSRRPSRQP